MASQQASPPPPEPLLPSELIDLATQRTWVASSLVALQAYKFYQFIQYSFVDGHQGTAAWLLFRWCLADAFIIGWAIPRLKIPRLDWPIQSRLILCLPLLLLNYVLFSSSFWTLATSLPTVLSSAFLPEWKVAVDEHFVRPKTILDSHEHILGRHTVHILPHATARINPSGQTYCLPVDRDAKTSVSIPLFFNNTTPSQLTYSLTSLDTGEQAFHEVSESQLRLKSALVKRVKHTREEDFEDEWSMPYSSNHHPAQKNTEQAPTTASHVLHVHQPGILRLEKVLTAQSNIGEISFSRTDAVLITECPTLSFSTSHRPIQHRCVGDTENPSVRLSGVPPLTLEYIQTHTTLDSTKKGKTEEEPITVESITSGNEKLTRGQSLHTTVPRQLALAEIGVKSLRLVKVTDANGHTTTVQDKQEQSVAVHAVPRISFKHTQPIRLRVKTTGEAIVALDAREPSGSVYEAGPWKIGYKVPGSEKVLEATVAATKNTTRSGLLAKIKVDREGEYELVSIKGRYCDGEVLAPSTINVIYQAEPSVELQFVPITDECAGAIGLKAQVTLSGEPPFKLHYKVVAHPGSGPNKGKTSTQSFLKEISNAHDEIVFQPDQFSEFTWEASRLEDAVYHGNAGINLQKQNLKQKTVIQPLASAKWVGDGPKEIRTCEGDSISADLQLKGVAPWTVDLETQFGSYRQKFTERNIRSDIHTLTVPIPAKANKSGGTFSVSIANIQDGRGCKRIMHTTDLIAHVHRTKPTARFYSISTRLADRTARIKDGQSTKLPLRLTGEAPWSLTYQLHPESGKLPNKQIIRVSAANGDILVNEEGKYELLEISDKYCRGTILPKEAQFSVEFISRPSLSLSMGETGGHQHRWLPSAVQHARRRSDVCLNAMDSIDLILKGAAPFRVSYTHSSPSGKQSKSLFAVQENANLPLITSEPGQHTYEIHGVSDSVYENAPDGLLLNAEASQHVPKIRFEQHVLPLPTGVFRVERKAPRYCVNDKLGGSTTSTGLLLHLTGQPPFNLELEVKAAGSTQKPQRFPVHNIHSKDWEVVIPFAFEKPGRHEVTLWSIRDANGCEKVVDQSAKTGSTQWDEDKLQIVKAPAAMVDVAEVATIKALSAQTDHCVGDSLDFLLQGTSPWVITYLWQTQEKQITVRKPTFSRLAEKAGIFAITSISHQHTQCKSAVSDIVKEIHPLPKVKVSSGGNCLSDIREGDEASITFQFEGTPPFSFTYVRSSADHYQEVLEEKTVTDIYEHSYTIHSAIAGSWSTIFIADKFCSFPPRAINRHVSKS